MKRKIKYVVTAVRWFDRVNGNTYHSANIARCSDGKTLYCQFQYGYGDQYRATALRAMLEAGWLPKKYSELAANGLNTVWSYERENNYPIMWNVTDGLKRDCVRNGKA